tara:strand:- start:485 stop:1150 length:666 start_codon:yes stop_codon:yes gene_type:complete
MKESTIYQKSIKLPAESTTGVLKKGSNNAKLGFKVTSKKWKGKRLYSLTLTERDTCDNSCHHWEDCYGNNMPFAHRFSTVGLIPKLREEIAILLAKHKEGVVIRLHVLGDFYSSEYINFWGDMLRDHPKLCVFGYTGLPPAGDLAEQIGFLNIFFPDKCVIRFSRNEAYCKDPNTLPDMYAADESFEGDSFTCPEQEGKVKSCAACGLCWTTTKTVKFLSH